MDDRRFETLCRRTTIKRDRACVDVEYLLDVLEVYCAVHCPRDRNELAEQLAFFLWHSSEAWDRYIELANTDYLARDALRLLLRTVLEAYDAKARIPHPEDALRDLQLWGLRVAAEERPKGPGQRGESRVSTDRNEAIVLTLNRIAAPDTPGESTFRLVATRLTKTKDGRPTEEPLSYHAVAKVWSQNKGRVTQSDAERRWWFIERSVELAAELVHTNDELGHELGVWLASPLEAIRRGLYGSIRSDR